tara:strand:- start:4304 stop:5038 length:735 start_codon:yes stop_codon:yes gene_type:complete
VCRQIEVCPPVLEEYIDAGADYFFHSAGIDHGSLFEHWRDCFAASNGRRVLPLDDDEKMLVQAAATREGDSVAVRLRNAALIAVLMSPRPKHRYVRPDHIRQIMYHQLAGLGEVGQNDPASLSRFLEVGQSGYICAGYFIDDGRPNWRTHLIALDADAQMHMSFYLNSSDGWVSIKHSLSNHLWPAVGRGGAFVGQDPRPISRQRVIDIVRSVGESANITGTLTPDILTQVQPWVPKVSKSAKN